MPRRTLRLVCHDCRQVMTKDDRLHYGYQCHACVISEHDLLLLAGRDPDHPDLSRLATAVDVGLRAPRAAAEGGATAGHPADGGKIDGRPRIA